MCERRRNLCRRFLRLAGRESNGTQVCREGGANRAACECVSIESHSGNVDFISVCVVKIRLDKLLLERGLVPSRERAQALIVAGRVLVNEQKVEKPGTSVPADAELRLLGDDLRYVGRGGLKLEHALSSWHIDVTGRTCVDVGASTGGFTDCLLQHGAANVIAIDTGYGQMDARLRSDSRVRLLEKTNARYLRAEDLQKKYPQETAATAAGPIDFLAMDVSFISATLVLPAVVASIQEAAGSSPTRPRRLEAVVLVKPQFEAGREQVGKGGIVRDAAAQQAAVERVRSAMAGQGFGELEMIESPILGAEGNREFLLHGIKNY
jgi:23S rRNA (cytidine1920-2'-O)/16S rRNA (cytidine1409-2'-O)-methyltransferase